MVEMSLGRPYGRRCQSNASNVSVFLVIAKVMPVMFLVFLGKVMLKSRLSMLEFLAYRLWGKIV